MAETSILAIGDADFAAMLRDDPSLPCGVALAQGGIEDRETLARLRHVATRLRAGGYPFWAMVAAAEAVGLCSYKSVPSPGGEVEIGYGVAPTRRRRGHATRAIAALVAQARADRAIASLSAQTLPENHASNRVLEENGFLQIGTRLDPAEGTLLLWQLRLAPWSP